MEQGLTDQMCSQLRQRLESNEKKLRRATLWWQMQMRMMASARAGRTGIPDATSAMIGNNQAACTRLLRAVVVSETRQDFFAELAHIVQEQIGADRVFALAADPDGNLRIETSTKLLSPEDRREAEMEGLRRQQTETAKAGSTHSRQGREARLAAAMENADGGTVAWSFAPGEPGLLGRAALAKTASVIDDLPEFLERQKKAERAKRAEEKQARKGAEAAGWYRVETGRLLEQRTKLSRRPAAACEVAEEGSSQGPAVLEVNPYKDLFGMSLEEHPELQGVLTWPIVSPASGGLPEVTIVLQCFSRRNFSPSDTARLKGLADAAKLCLRNSLIRTSRGKVLERLQELWLGPGAARGLGIPTGGVPPVHVLLPRLAALADCEQALLLSWDKRFGVLKEEIDPTATATTAPGTVKTQGSCTGPPRLRFVVNARSPCGYSVLHKEKVFLHRQYTGKFQRAGTATELSSSSSSAAPPASASTFRCRIRGMNEPPLEDCGEAVEESLPGAAVEFEFEGGVPGTLASLQAQLIASLDPTTGTAAGRTAFRAGLQAAMAEAGLGTSGGVRCESLACVPLEGPDGEVIGATLLLNSRNTRFGAEEEALLEGFNALVGKARKEEADRERIAFLGGHIKSTAQVTRDLIHAENPTQAKARCLAHAAMLLAPCKSLVTMYLPPEAALDEPRQRRLPLSQGNGSDGGWGGYPVPGSAAPGKPWTRYRIEGDAKISKDWWAPLLWTL